MVTERSRKKKGELAQRLSCIFWCVAVIQLLLRAEKSNPTTDRREPTRWSTARRSWSSQGSHGTKEERKRGKTEKTTENAERSERENGKGKVTLKEARKRMRTETNLTGSRRQLEVCVYGGGREERLWREHIRPDSQCSQVGVPHAPGTRQG